MSVLFDKLRAKGWNDLARARIEELLKRGVLHGDLLVVSPHRPASLVAGLVWRSVTGGRFPAPRAATTSSGTSIPVAVLP